MRRFFIQFPLHVQLACLAGLCVILTAGSALVAGLESWSLSVRLTTALATTGAVCLVYVAGMIKYLLRPMRGVRAWMSEAAEGRDSVVGLSVGVAAGEVQHLAEVARRLVERMRDANARGSQAQEVLAARTRTVNQLLEFSQTVQGIGQAEQVFQTLCHYLRTELGLAGVIAMTSDPESVPAIQVRAQWPGDLMKAPTPAVGVPGGFEMDASLCPCLRQNLPRVFRPDGSPVRCAIDQNLNLPATLAAYCVPFTVGRKVQVVVHMLLPEGQDWTEDRRQLAQTYVNTAHSGLVSLHLLAEAEKQSMTDVLTGLYNRRSMESLLQREVALAERYNHPLSVVMVDMDKFKEVNDAHGHAAGDHLLRSFADCVRMTLRKTDLAFRYGGDEFVIALPQTGVMQAQQVVQKLRQAFAAVDFSSAIAHLEVQPTLSVGVAERSKATNVLTLSNLLGAADQALYEAKGANRNCVRVYQPPQAA